MSKGIIIPIMEKYENLLLCNLHFLRNELGCKLPIELWQINQEVSDLTQQKLETLQEQYNLSLKNVAEYTDNPEHWRGWQIKAFILKCTEFHNVILCDCDSVFLKNPETIFDDPNYISTGTYFFKDWIKHVPKNREIEIPARKLFIRSLMPEKNQYFPEEWNYIYEIPDTVQSMWYYQEAGVVYFNKIMLPDVLETIYKLNKNHDEIYKYIYGDKETFWLACCMNNKPFYMNPICAENYKADTKLPYIDNVDDSPNAFGHFYDGTLFFSQKGYPLLQTSL
jgi:hypothetical protein